MYLHDYFTPVKISTGDGLILILVLATSDIVLIYTFIYKKKDTYHSMFASKSTVDSIFCSFFDAACPYCSTRPS